MLLYYLKDILNLLRTFPHNLHQTTQEAMEDAREIWRDFSLVRELIWKKRVVGMFGEIFGEIDYSLEAEILPEWQFLNKKEIWSNLNYLFNIFAPRAPFPFFSPFKARSPQFFPGALENEQHLSTKERSNRVSWFFINGILSDERLAKLNQQRLEKVFGRPIGLIYNPMDSFFGDFWECTMGRTLDWKTEPGKYTADLIFQALHRYDKVILLAHSQGSLIAGEALWQLSQKLLEDKQLYLLRKLELYFFACPADEIKVASGETWPHIEHFVNEFDFFSQLGILTDYNKRFKLPGRIYLRKEHYGHLLNACYLAEFDQEPYIYDPRVWGSFQERARLYQYLSGNSPSRFLAK